MRSDSGPKLIMERGMAQEMRGTPSRLGVTRFDDLTYDLAGLIGGGDGRKNLRDFSTPQLLTAAPGVLAATGASAAAARLEAHERLAQPLLAPVAALIGFSMLLLGGFSRFGVGRQVVVAIIALLAARSSTARR